MKNLIKKNAERKPLPKEASMLPIGEYVRFSNGFLRVEEGKIVGYNGRHYWVQNERGDLVTVFDFAIVR